MPRSACLRKASGPLTIPLVVATVGHYRATGVTIPLAGNWILKLTVRTTAIDEDVVTATTPCPLEASRRVGCLRLYLCLRSTGAGAVLEKIVDPRGVPKQTHAGVLTPPRWCIEDRCPKGALGRDWAETVTLTPPMAPDDGLRGEDIARDPSSCRGTI